MTESKGRILLVCYYFPPLGGAGVNRPVQLYRSLPAYGYACDVLTVKPVTYRVYEPELLPQEMSGRIYRSGSRDPQRLMYLLGKRSVAPETIEQGRIVSDRFFPDPKIGWVKPAVALGRTIVENRHYRCIISTSPPISSHLVGHRLADEFNLPWIADFRDLWTALPIEQSYRSGRMVKKGQALLQRIRQAADTIVAVNTSVGAYVGAGSVIGNAYHEQFASHWRKPSDSPTITIGLLGTFNELYPLEPLLDLLVELRDRSPQTLDRLRELHVGSVDSVWLADVLERRRLTERVTSLGRLGRKETIEQLSEASLFYVATDRNRGRAFSTGRIFTLLPSGRPLLACCHPDSELAALVGKTENGFTFDGSSASRAAAWLVDLIERAAHGEEIILDSPAYAADYSELRLAESFAGLLDKITAR